MRVLLGLVASVDLWAPLPAGAAVAVLPGGVIRRRPVSGLIGAALAAAGWFVSPVLGILGLSAGLVVVARSGKKAHRSFRCLVAALLPPAAGAAMAEGFSPGSTGPIGWIGRRPLLLAGSCVAIAIAGLALRRAMRPELDPLRHATPEMRREVIDRDGNRCCYCGANGNALGVQLALDHVVPWAKGGRTHPSNLQLLCPVCNSLKSDLSDKEARRRFQEQHGFEAGSFPKNWLQRLLY